MKALVTGYKGFVGSNLVKFLTHENVEVLGLDENYLENHDTWGKDLEKTVTDYNPSVVFHVGACSDTLEKRVNYIMIRNYESTKILTDWCSKNQVPIIYSSSAANYGTNGTTPSNLYGWSKYTGEGYVCANRGIALRYFNVYGPGESNKGRMASFVYQACIKEGMGEQILLFPKEPRRDFVYVADVVSANIHAWKNYDTLEKKYYEVGTGKASQFEELMYHMGYSFEYTEEDMIPEGYQFYTCSDKEKWMPLWTSKFSLVEGIDDYKKYLFSMDLERS